MVDGPADGSCHPSFGGGQHLQLLQASRMPSIIFNRNLFVKDIVFLVDLDSRPGEGCLGSMINPFLVFVCAMAISLGYADGAFSAFYLGSPVR